MSEDKTDRIIGVVVALCMTAIVAIALLSACSTGDTESGDASTAYTESGAPLKGGVTDLEKAANVLEKAADYARGGLS